MPECFEIMTWFLATYDTSSGKEYNERKNEKYLGLSVHYSAQERISTNLVVKLNVDTKFMVL